MLDAEQIVIRGELVLCLLLRMEARLREQVTDSVSAAATAAGLHVACDLDPIVVDPRRRGRPLVTVMGEPLCPEALAGITRRIADAGGNIDRIERPRATPGGAPAYRPGASEAQLRRELAAESAAGGLDVAVQRLALARRGTHLVVMDVDRR